MNFVVISSRTLRKDSFDSARISVVKLNGPRSSDVSIVCGWFVQNSMKDFSCEGSMFRAIEYRFRFRDL